MKLHSPEFQRGLQRAVRRAIRASKELRKEYRRVRRSGGRRLPEEITRIAVTFIFLCGFVAATGGPAGFSVETGLAWIALWTFAAVFFYALQWTIYLVSHADIRAMRLLPVSDEVIFRWQFQRLIRYASKAYLDILIGFAVLGCLAHFTVWQWAPVPFIAALTWLTMLSLAALCATRLPAKLCRRLLSGMLIPLFIAILVMAGSHNFLRPWLAQAAPTINLVLPTGWAASLFRGLLPGRQPTFLLPLLPVILLIISAKDSLQRLRRSAEYREYLRPDAPDIFPDEEPGIVDEKGAQPARHAGPTEIEEIIETRRFMEIVPWAGRGWLERLLWNWLTPRERALGEFAFPKGYAITIPGLKIVRNLIVVGGVGFAARYIVSREVEFWIFGLGLIVVVGQVLNRLMGSGEAFRAMNLGGIKIPLHATFGIGYRELSGLLIKCTIVQILFYLPVLTLPAALCGAWFGLSWQSVMLCGLKLGLLALAGRFLLLTTSFSAGTNDTSRFRLSGILLLLIFVPCCAGLIALCIAGMVIPHPLVAELLCLAAIAAGWMLYRIYGWFYANGRFDLIAIQK